MNVVILGQNGMAGHVVKDYFRAAHNFSVMGFGREAFDINVRRYEMVATKLSSLCGLQTDWVINCVGVIKPQMHKDMARSVFVNGIFPRYLADWGKETDTKVLHITTDCVFQGTSGKYTESSQHDALDEYGKTKSLGEPDNCMVVRTSIIGPEFGGRKRSFLEWVLGQHGTKVNGYTNHLWNGVTTLELARVLSDIVSSNLYSEGVSHVFSEDITKFDMVRKIKEGFGLDFELNPVEAPISCNRTLRTEKGLNSLVKPLGFDSMLEEMYTLCVD
jgi:dTDP-4-dehydrorhamnose reductase